MSDLVNKSVQLHLLWVRGNVRFAHELRFATSRMCRVFMSCQSELSIKLALSCDWDYFKLMVLGLQTTPTCNHVLSLSCETDLSLLAQRSCCSWGVYKTSIIGLRIVRVASVMRGVSCGSVLERRE